MCAAFAGNIAHSLFVLGTHVFCILHVSEQNCVQCCSTRQSLSLYPPPTPTPTPLSLPLSLPPSLPLLSALSLSLQGLSLRCTREMMHFFEASLAGEKQLPCTSFRPFSLQNILGYTSQHCMALPSCKIQRWGTTRCWPLWKVLH